MKIYHKQQGMTTVTIILGFLLLAFFVLIAVTLFPIYSEHFNVSSHIARISKDTSSRDSTKEDIERTLLKRFDIDDVKNVKTSDISVTANGAGGYTIDVEYEVRKPLIANIDIVVYFHDVGEVR